MATTAKPKALHFTGNDEADALLAQNPLALLIGFALDQQITVPAAFSGPLKLKQRLGTLEPREIAHADRGELEKVFREKPAIHRFPGSMAKRVQEIAAIVDEDYGGKADRIWTEASDGADLRRRLSSLPGFGPMTVTSISAVLAKRFGIDAAQELVPNHPTLGDVDSPKALEEYQAKKRAHKAEMRAKQRA